MLTLELRLVLETPLHIGSTPSETLHSFARDLRGRPCIPATTSKGLHRVATEQVAAALRLPVCNAPVATQMCQPIAGKPACPVCRIFGSPWLAGRVRYRNLSATVAPTIDTTIRATQSRRRRVELSRHETQYEVLPAGTIFSGSIDHQINDPALLGLALAGLRSVKRIGAGSGYGLCNVEARALDSTKSPINDSDLAEALRSLARVRP